MGTWHFSFFVGILLRIPAQGDLDGGFGVGRRLDYSTCSCWVFDPTAKELITNLSILERKIRSLTTRKAKYESPRELKLFVSKNVS